MAVTAPVVVAAGDDGDVGGGGNNDSDSANDADTVQSELYGSRD